MNGPDRRENPGPADMFADWPHPHPPRYGCGCNGCHGWIMGQIARAALDAAGRRDVIGRWWRIYRPGDDVPSVGRWP